MNMYDITEKAANEAYSQFDYKYQSFDKVIRLYTSFKEIKGGNPMYNVRKNLRTQQDYQQFEEYIELDEQAKEECLSENDESVVDNSQWFQKSEASLNEKELTIQPYELSFAKKSQAPQVYVYFDSVTSPLFDTK
jgi:hypothetical protein